MDEKMKKDLGDAVKHVGHGIEDIADVAAHGVGGAVKGLADGVESASAETKVREDDNESST